MASVNYGYGYTGSSYAGLGLAAGGGGGLLSVLFCHGWKSLGWGGALGGCGVGREGRDG